MEALTKHPITRKIKLIALAVLFTVQLSSLFSKSLEERIADFSNLSGKEQVDTLIELYSDIVYFQRRIQFIKFAHIIIKNPNDTRDYILEKFKATKPVPYEQTPSDFAILLFLLEEAKDYISPNGFYKSIDDYKYAVHNIYRLKMDEYLREYKVIDFQYTMLLDYVLSIETGTRHITALEDLPGLLDELTAQGYEGLSIDTYCIYERSFYEE